MLNAIARAVSPKSRGNAEGKHPVRHRAKKAKASTVNLIALSPKEVHFAPRCPVYYPATPLLCSKAILSDSVLDETVAPQEIGLSAQATTRTANSYPEAA
jgi:hypothetical protein